MSTYKVGQQLWFVRAYGSEKGCLVTITKVGHKYLTLDHGNPYYRLDPTTLIADGRGYNSPGRAYLNEQAYIDECEHMEAVTKLKRVVQSFSNRFSHLSTKQLNDIIKQLQGESDGQ